MADRDKSLPTMMADAVIKAQNELVPRVAKLMAPVAGNEKVSKDERHRRWWQEDEGWTPEREMTLLTGLNPDGTPAIDPRTGMPAKPISREDVGLLKYPNREIDARAAAGADDERGAAKYAREMSEMGPPAPDPLGQAALEVAEPAPATLAAPSAPEPPVAATVPEMGVM